MDTGYKMSMKTHPAVKFDGSRESIMSSARSRKNIFNTQGSIIVHDEDTPEDAKLVIPTHKPKINFKGEPKDLISSGAFNSLQAKDSLYGVNVRRLKKRQIRTSINASPISPNED
jgi:hypothetical protein